MRIAGPAAVGRTRQQLMQTDLQPGERLVWDGSPDTARWFFSNDRLLISFSLSGAASRFWEASVLTATTTRGGQMSKSPETAMAPS